jgi:hypothetical protein
MKSFALITEGITDQAVLENILDGLTGGTAITRALRPLRDETDLNRVAKEEFSNWELVLEYLKSEDILDAIQTNDFVVIQIDTDQCEQPNFDVSLHNNSNKMKNIQDIVTDCIAKMQSLLNPAFPPDEMFRLMFAIPVLSSECWLLSLADADHMHSEKLAHSCEKKLAHFLKLKNKSLSKEYEQYSKFSSDFRKPKVLARVANKALCLKIFIDDANTKVLI